jgi:Fe-S cluster assembly ATPase SufC
MFEEIRPEGSTVTSEEIKQKARDYAKAKRAQKKAMKLATGQIEPKAIETVPVVDEFDMSMFTPRSQKQAGRPKSIVNKVTEYGALFNSMNETSIKKGMGELTTAMETLIMAMQPDSGLDIKERAKIAEKIASYESSRAPIISIEHVQNITREDEGDADEALNDFIQTLNKV